MHRLTNVFLMPLTLLSLIGLVGLPLLFILLQAIFPYITRGSFAEPFALILPTLTDPLLLELVGNTLALGLAVVLGCLLVALPLGALRALTRVPGGAVWDLIFLIPFMIPPYIAALAWMTTLQTRGYSEQLMGFSANDFLFSFWGITFVMVLNVFPVVYFAVSRTLAVVGSRYAAVGRVCGAGAWRAFFKLTLPLSIPGLAASLLLVFALSIEEFGTPATLGAQAGFKVLVTGIHERFSDWPLDMPGAAILSLILVGLAMLAFYLQHWIVTRRSYVSQGSKPASFEPVELGRARWPVAILFALVGVISVGVPIFSVLATSLSTTLSGGLSIDNLTFNHYQSLFANQSGAMAALTNSLTLATGTALVTGVLGALVAYLVVRASISGKGLLDLLSLLPNTLPGIVVAVGLILVWNQPVWSMPIYNTGWMLLLAYSCLLLPYPVRYASAALRQIGSNLEAAARVSGASLLISFVRIVVPIMMPALLVAMLLVFAIASRELVASLMVAPAGMSTVSTFVFGQFEQGLPGVGMAMSVMAIFSTTGLLVLLTTLARKKLPSGVI